MSQPKYLSIGDVNMIECAMEILCRRSKQWGRPLCTDIEGCPRHC